MYMMRLQSKYSRECHWLFVAAMCVPLTVGMQTISIWADEAHDRLAIGRSLRLQGKPAEALAWVDHACRLSPNYDTILERGKVWFELGKYDLAMADFTAAAQLSPQQAEPWYLRARIWWKQGKPKAAESDLNQALEREPNFFRARLDRAEVRRLQGKQLEALRDIEALMEVSEPAPITFFVRGKIRIDIQDWAGAESDFGRYLAVVPTNAEAYIERARARAELGDMTAAWQDLEHAIRLSPQLAEAYALQAGLAMRIENPGLAEQKWTQAIARAEGPQAARYHWQRAVVRQALGRPEEALSDLRTALSLDPTLASEFSVSGDTKEPLHNSPVLYGTF